MRKKNKQEKPVIVYVEKDVETGNVKKAIACKGVKNLRKYSRYNE